MIYPRFPWSALLLATAVLAGCDGEESRIAAAVKDIKAALGIGAARPPADAAAAVLRALDPQEFHRHEMKAFRGGWNQGFAHACLKLLISALGPLQLIEHLQNFKQGTKDPQEIAAADQFIELIIKVHASSGIVDTEKFLNDLQYLAPFNQRNIIGGWKLQIESDLFTTEKEPRRFLPLIAELFRLDTLPGWSFAIDETYVHQGEEQANYDVANPFEMFQSVETSRLAPADLEPFNLQKAVDLLHADQERQVKWGEGDTHFTTVTVRRQVSIADVQKFKRLSISLPDSKAVLLPATFPDHVTLPAVDRKTGQKLVLTLAPKEVITLSIPSYAVHIRNHAGQWLIHSEQSVSPNRYQFDANIGRLINFVVISALPAP